MHSAVLIPLLNLITLIPPVHPLYPPVQQPAINYVATRLGGAQVLHELHIALTDKANYNNNKFDLDIVNFYD